MIDLHKALSKPLTEFEVQAECYHLLKQHYPLVRGEIKVQFDKPDKNVRRERGARFDLVICDTNKTPLFIVEVKRTETTKNSKQSHYETLTGLPCFTIGSVAQCEELIHSLNN